MLPERTGQEWSHPIEDKKKNAVSWTALDVAGYSIGGDGGN